MYALTVIFRNVLLPIFMTLYTVRKRVYCCLWTCCRLLGLSSLWSSVLKLISIRQEKICQKTKSFNSFFRSVKHYDRSTCHGSIILAILITKKMSVDQPSTIPLLVCLCCAKYTGLIFCVCALVPDVILVFVAICVLVLARGGEVVFHF